MEKIKISDFERICKALSNLSQPSAPKPVEGEAVKLLKEVFEQYEINLRNLMKRNGVNFKMVSILFPTYQKVKAFLSQPSAPVESEESIFIRRQHEYIGLGVYKLAVTYLMLEYAEQFKK